MVVSGYCCNNCGEFWEWESDAKECCADIYEAWQCKSCSEVYDDELDADSCCFFESDCW